MRLGGENRGIEALQVTDLENALRTRAGQSGYPGGFIEHYITGLIYPEGLDRTQQVVLGVFVLVLNVGIYTWLLWRRRRLQPR